MDSEFEQLTVQAERLAGECDHIAREILSSAMAEADQLGSIAEQEARLADTDRAYGAAEACVIQRRQVISTARAEAASAQARLSGLERRHGEMDARRARLGTERASLQPQHVDITRQAGELERHVEQHRLAVREAAVEKTRLENVLGDLKAKIRIQEDEVDESKIALSNARSRCAALRELRERLEGVGAGTKAVVGMHDDCVVGLVADRVEAPVHLTHALAGLLGTDLQGVVVRDMDRGIELLEGLAKAHMGRATIVHAHPSFTAGAATGEFADGAECRRLVDSLQFAPEDEGLVRCLIGDAIVVKDVTMALALRQSGTRAPIVTVDGMVLHIDGRIEGGQGDDLSAGMLEGKREARELASEIERLEPLLAGLLASLAASREQIAEIGRSLDASRQEVHARELVTLTSEKDLQKNRHQLQSLEQRMAALEAEEIELAEAICEARSERDAVADGLRDVHARIEVAHEELRKEESQLVGAGTRRDAERESLLARRVSLAAVAERLAAARAVQVRLGRSVTELQERKAHLVNEIAVNQASFEETALQLARLESALHENVGRASRAREALESARAQTEELRAKLEACESDLREHRTRVDVLRDELQAHEMKLREKRLTLDHLLASVAERFRGLNLPSVVGDYHMRSCPDDVSRARIDELVRLIERMGSVNLDATRELADAEERFAFYTTQKLDLEKALADLQRALHQMNRESRRLFEETFHAVNSRFKEIFPRMFQGGRAELRMTNPDDLLETGIDIIAQPPGKKLSNIELMSGGEKALTAVSLIFAIFQIRPSPFCILDEVDAPLDDANVGRYNETIRSMTDRSQFILITHHKRTMQMVDVLYGVTMPEAGVSKIVSVRINDSLRRTIVPPAEVAVA
jgi:chromosome segregation protein